MKQERKSVSSMSRGTTLEFLEINAKTFLRVRGVAVFSSRKKNVQG